MGAGLEVYSQNAVLTTSVTDAITKVLGSYQIPNNGSNSGSLNIADFSKGSPFYQMIANGSIGSSYWIPWISISGITLSWEYRNPGTGQTKLQKVFPILIYGIY